MSLRRKFIIGNWKMNPDTAVLAAALYRNIEKGIEKGIQKGVTASKKVIVVACPPFVFLESLAKKSSQARSGRLILGAQDVFYEPSGAHTGEISAAMLSSLGVRYSIVGHSERRAMGESDDVINKKVVAALHHGLTPILCVGEKTRDDEGSHLVKVKEQVLRGLSGISRAELDSVIIAYEPVFAVGAAQALDAHSVHEMILYIKKILIDTYKSKIIETPILYGGAVDSGNAAELLTKGNADGFLIGRQSLDPESFLTIWNIATSVK